MVHLAADLQSAQRTTGTVVVPALRRGALLLAACVVACLPAGADVVVNDVSQLNPIVKSVKSIRLVLANGDVASASPTENPELFYGAMGGYGGLGVIVEATLWLTDNVRVERRSVVMPLSAYRSYWAQARRVFS